jgi:carbon dioxide concentrating mechanism protein CcmN
MPTKLRSISRESIPIHLAGNVSIDPSAAIAVGVLLQAEVDCRITIGAGVCIGTGTIIHATSGNLDICAGVCIGRSVLMMGNGTINRNACVGAGTTVINPQIAEEAVIPAHSLLGDLSRSGDFPTVDDTSSVPQQISTAEDLPPSTNFGNLNDPWHQPAADHSETVTPIVTDPTPPAGLVVPSQNSSSDVEIEISPRSTSTVAGRANFDQLKRQLFPNG